MSVKALTPSIFGIPGKHAVTNVVPAPLSISSLKLWIAADRYTLYNDGQNLTTLADLSPAKNDMTGNTVYMQNVYNSKPALYFNNTNHMVLPYSQTNPFTLFAVYEMISSGASQRVIASDDNNWLMGNWQGTHDNYFCGGWVCQNQTAEDYIPHVWTCAENGGTSSFWRHKTQLASNSYGNNPVGILSLGGSGGEYSAAYIFEVILYNRVLSANEILKLQNYLIGRWQISS